MTAGDHPAAALPWLAPVIEQVLAMPTAHAVLLHGAPGDGAFECAQSIAQAWLCEGQGPRPCGHCEACHLVRQGLHADLHRLMPEELRVQLGVGGAEGEGDGEGRAAKRKPSRQIRIDEVRAAIDWIVTTSSRGRAKVVLIHPGEALNPQSANALLKTLEEPPRGARLLISAAEPEQLLPTVRSRCQRVRLQPPRPEQALSWLQAQGVADAPVLLAASSGRPLEALALAAAGIDARRWSELPKAVLAAHGAALAGLPPARVLDVLHKLCHDGLALLAGGTPRFFVGQPLPAPRSAAALAAWSRELAAMARRIDHPWNEGLLLDALLLRARAAWRGEASDTLAVP